jgi:hypothetical protein
MPWLPIKTITQHPGETPYSYNNRAANHISKLRRWRADGRPLRRVHRDEAWCIERLEA